MYKGSIIKVFVTAPEPTEMSEIMGDVLDCYPEDVEIMNMKKFPPCGVSMDMNECYVYGFAGRMYKAGMYAMFEGIPKEDLSNRVHWAVEFQ